MLNGAQQSAQRSSSAPPALRTALGYTKSRRHAATTENPVGLLKIELSPSTVRINYGVFRGCDVCGG
jgi:hypothetical protein